MSASAFEAAEVEPLGPFELNVGEITAPLAGQLGPIRALLEEALPELDEDAHRRIVKAFVQAAKTGARVALGELAGTLEARYPIKLNSLLIDLADEDES